METIPMAVNQIQRAFLGWPVLTWVAQKGQSITYKELSTKIGVHHRALRYVLEVIQNYCLDERLPPLTIVVVNQKTRSPGAGFIAWDVDDIETGFAKVYGYNWALLSNPFSYAADGTSEIDLIDKIINYPESATDVYLRVKVRGRAQLLFREALLRVYEYRCAFCGFSFKESLDAAHIIPWSDASTQQRLDPSNGLLLCSNHHRMFDAGRMTISQSMKVVYCSSVKRLAIKSPIDRIMTIELHGRNAFIPSDLKHKPSPEALAFHHEKCNWKDQEG